MKRKKEKPIEKSILKFDQIKKLVILAMFSDDKLMERLVLKGGNAVDIIYNMSSRSSVDVDFSLESDFLDSERDEFRERMENTLKSTFSEKGYEVFDFNMVERPAEVTAEMAAFWGGYEIEFKMIEKEIYKRFSQNIQDVRVRAIDLGRGKKFLIDISKHEFITPKQLYEIDGLRIFVYTPEMIVCEKLRAICQQMPEYGEIVNRSRLGGARARDFLDIFTIVNGFKIEVASDENLSLLRKIFDVKKVPLTLLGKIKDYRDFHQKDFPAVKDTVKVGDRIEDFNYYFDFILDLVAKLKSLWDV